MLRWLISKYKIYQKERMLICLIFKSKITKLMYTVSYLSYVSHQSQSILCLIFLIKLMCVAIMYHYTTVDKNQLTICSF